MASTNKTEHLGLCQWVKTDHFLMDDMNNTLEKIDAAIGGMSRVKLFDVTVTEAVPAVELDFTDIDLAPFAELEIFMSFHDNGTAFRINGVSKQIYNFTSAVGGGILDKIIARPGTSRISITPTDFFHHNGGVLQIERMSRLDFPELQTLNFFRTSSGSTFRIGNRISVWGVKW